MRLIRLFIFWFLAFVTSYGINILMVLVWSALGNNNFILLVGMMNAPIVYLLFGWLYFRPGFAIKFSARIKSTIIWIVLDFVGGMLILELFSGLDYTNMFSPISFLIETTNLLALLLAGYLSLQLTPHSATTLPQSSVPPRQGQA